jgi:hypothetical protein
MSIQIPCDGPEDTSDNYVVDIPDEAIAKMADRVAELMDRIGGGWLVMIVEEMLREALWTSHIREVPLGEARNPVMGVPLPQLPPGFVWGSEGKWQPK